jgi:MFS family permease
LGLYLDRRNPKETALISQACCLLGCVGFGVAAYTKVDLWIPSFGLIGFGGYGFYLSIVGFSNLFPNNRALIVAVVVSSFSLSQLMGLVVLYAFEGGISLAVIYFAQAVLIFIWMILILFLWPWRMYRPGARVVFRDNLPWQICRRDFKATARAPSGRRPKLRNQIFSKPYQMAFWFYLIILFLLGFYLATAQQQLALMGDAQTGYFYTKMFNIIGCLGFVSIPLFGVLADRYGFEWTYFLATCFTILYPFFALFNNLPLQYVTFSMWALCRQWTFSSNFAYIAAEFGHQNYGLLVGVVTFGAGAFSNVQYGVLAFILTVLNGDFYWWNLGTAVGCFFLLLIPLFIGLRHQKQKRLAKLKKKEESNEIPQNVNNAESPEIAIDMEEESELDFDMEPSLQESVHTEYHNAPKKINPRRYMMKKESSIVNIGHMVHPMHMIPRQRLPLAPPSRAHIYEQQPGTTKRQLQSSKLPSLPAQQPAPSLSRHQQQPHNQQQQPQHHQQQQQHQPPTPPQLASTNDNSTHSDACSGEEPRATPVTDNKKVMNPPLKVAFQDSGSVSESEVEQSRSSHSSD